MANYNNPSPKKKPSLGEVLIKILIAVASALVGLFTEAETNILTSIIQ